MFILYFGVLKRIYIGNIGYGMDIVIFMTFSHDNKRKAVGRKA